MNHRHNRATGGPGPGPRRAAEAGGRPGGFTLVELLTIVIILGMLITLAAPSLLQARKGFRTNQSRAYIAILQGAINQHRLDWKDHPRESRYPDHLRGLPRSDRGHPDMGQGSMQGRHALVQALTGYMNTDGAVGRGSRWRLDEPGKRYGPYVASDQSVSSDGNDPAFVDAFGNEIFYYRYQYAPKDGTDGFLSRDNSPGGPAPFDRYLQDPNTLRWYRRDYILVTKGADGRWMNPSKTPPPTKTDDIANFDFSFKPKQDDPTN